MTEKLLERKLAAAVKQSGGLAAKFVSLGLDGMPDRLILMPRGIAAFVEVKALGRRPRLLQLQRHRLLRRLGFQVFVLDGPDQIGGILRDISAP